MIITRLSMGAGFTVRVPLEAADKVHAERDGNLLKIYWSDPEDYYVKGELISKWLGTKLVSKEGSYSVGPNDGTLHVDNKERNKYAENPFVIELKDDQELFITLYPYTTRMVYTENDVDRFTSDGHHEIKWVILDDEQINYVRHEEMPVAPEVPEHPEKREFDEWVPEIVEATEDAEYTATFKHIVEYKDSDNESVFAVEQVKNNYDAQMDKTPVKESDPARDYEFAYWVDEPVLRDTDPDTSDEIVSFGVVNRPSDPVELIYGNITPEGEILDSWAGIAKAVDDGVYSEIYELGNWKSVDSDNFGNLQYEIVAFDTDDDSQDKKIPLTWLARNVTTSTYRWDDTYVYDEESGVFTAPIPKYSESSIHKLLNKELFLTFPDELKKIIVPAKKTTRYGSETLIENYTIWLPSVYELHLNGWYSDYNAESDGYFYKLRETEKDNWLRSMRYENMPDFSSTNTYAYSCLDMHSYPQYPITPGFCTGGTPSIKPSPTTKLTPVTDDVTVYPYFESTPREYEITWIEGDTRVTEKVVYGEIPARDITPKQGYSARWTPEPYPVNGPETYVAVYDKLPPVNPDTHEINLTWDEIGTLVDNGTYTDVLSIGDWKSVDFGDEGNIPFEIVAFNKDWIPEKIEQHEYAPITWLARTLLNSEYEWGEDEEGFRPKYSESDLKKSLEGDVYSLIETSDDNPKDLIVPVIKSFNCSKEINQEYGISITFTEETVCPNLWVPSCFELGYPLSEIEGYGVNYFKDSENGVFESEFLSRVQSNDYPWVTRTNTASMSVINIHPDRGYDNGPVPWILLGFCSGGHFVKSYKAEIETTYGNVSESGEILDSWAGIAKAVDDGVWTEIYSVGNYKTVTVYDKFSIQFEIAGFGIDKVESSGKAPITWLARTVTPASIGEMNIYDFEENDYDQGRLRTYVENDLAKGIEYHSPDNPISYSVEVEKTFRHGYLTNGETSSIYSKLWIPSAYEVFGPNYKMKDYILYDEKLDGAEQNGVDYSKYFSSKDFSSFFPIVEGYEVRYGEYWPLRTTFRANGGIFGESTNIMATIDMMGDIFYSSIAHMNDIGILLGFCTGGNTVKSYEPPVVHVDPETHEILDTWEQINEAMGNGEYLTRYSIGDWKSVNYGETYGTNVPMEIVAFDVDEMEDGEKAPITWISKNLLKGTYAWNESNTNEGGYLESDIRKSVERAFASIMGNDIPTPFVCTVNKTFSMGIMEGKETRSANFKAWVPSLRELGGWNYDVSQYIETSGPVYNEKFKDNNSCIKHTNETNTAAWWWLRSANYDPRYTEFTLVVVDFGYLGPNFPKEYGGLAIGFCTAYHDSNDFHTVTFLNNGKVVGTDVVPHGEDATPPVLTEPYFPPIDPETREILISWDEIATLVDEGSYKYVFQIGDWKSVNFGSTYGEDVPVEIVALDADEATNGGNAPITWISKDCLKGTYQWNAEKDNRGVYPESALRSTIETAYNSIIDSDSPKPYVVPVTKSYRVWLDTKSASFSVWAPSLREIYRKQGSLGITSYIEPFGPIYSDRFSGKDSCIKNTYGTTTAARWWLRSTDYAGASTKFGVKESGEYGFYNCSETGEIVLGFCTGGHPEEVYHTVRFHDPEGNVVQTSQVKDGECAVFEGDTSQFDGDDMQTFQGWEIGGINDCNIQDIEFIELSNYNITENTDFYAHSCSSPHRFGDVIIDGDDTDL